MLHAILVSVALLSSPTQCCGGGGCCFIGRSTIPFGAPMFQLSIAPPKVNIPAILRVDQYPQPIRVGLLMIAPRPLSSVFAATLQADAQTQR